MSFIQILILNTIFILFPNFIYILYIANKQNLKEKESDISFDICILLSIFLIISYSSLYGKNYLITFLLIILCFCIINKRILSYIIISSIICEYLYYLNNNSYLLIIMFCITILLYLKFKSSKSVMSIVSILTSIVIIVFNNVNVVNNILIFLIITFVLILWDKKVKEILELQNNLKSFKNEKELKISLFKIVHEIKNPLTVIKGYLSLMNLNDIEKSKKYINILKSETERTVNILDDFMQFSKIEIKKELFNYNEFIDNVESIVIPLLNSKNIIYKFITNENIFINADATRIKQVLVNMIKNSVEASQINGKITVKSVIKNEKLNIVIADDGCGMNKYTLKEIKTPFFTTKEKGTGLGVCLSREIIEAHKGKLIYISCIDKGTTVKIILPIS